MSGASEPTEEVVIKVSSQGAEAFVDSYYRALNDGQPLSMYYINSSTPYTSRPDADPADIVINGAHLATPAEYEVLLEEQRGGPAANNTNGADRRRGNHHPRVRYEVDSFDAQVINTDFCTDVPLTLSDDAAKASGRRISMVVTVMGILHLDSEPEPTRRTFNEVFVLWPNWEWDAKGASRNKPKNARNKFLISSQNYRML